MTYQELLEITKGINFDNVGDAQYTTGNGWTNARWSTQSSFMQFLTNCLNRNAVIRFSEKTDMALYVNHEFSIENGKVTKTK